MKLFHERRIKKVNSQGMMGESHYRMEKAVPNLVTAQSTLGYTEVRWAWLREVLVKGGTRDDMIDSWLENLVVKITPKGFYT